MEDAIYQHGRGANFENLKDSIMKLKPPPEEYKKYYIQGMKECFDQHINHKPYNPIG